jgi:DNA polymerase-3 subunit gamma/tau
MENYIVSARKYRPATFDTVVGQRALTTTLKNAIASGKLAHAYLFCGPRGVGKTTCARIFAKTINCQSPKADGEACNECESCRAFNEQRSFNIHELDAASNNSVEDIRQLIEQVRIPPQVGKYKVYIIDEVHMLSQAAFNAFLKTLEEPPHHAIFILATTEKHKILPTILSRCQIYDFSRISPQDTVEHLQYVASKEGIQAEPEALNVIAQKADGGMRDALSIFDQVASFTGGNITYQRVIENLNVLDYEYYFRLTDYMLENKASEAMLLFDEVLKKGFDGSHFITGLASHFRDLLVSRDAATLPLLQVGAAIAQRYEAQARKCEPKFLYRAMKLCNDCDLNYRTSKNKRLLVELTLIQCAQLTLPDADDLVGGLRPKRRLKPLFAQLAAQPASSQATPATPVKPQAQPAAAKVASITTMFAQKQQEEKKIPTMKLSQLSVSIRRNPNAAANPASAAQSAASSPAASAVYEDYTFNNNDLDYYWREYSTTLPVEEKANAARMMNIHPRLTADATFEVVVDNDIVEHYFNKMRPDIERFLRERLHNRRVAMTVRIAAPDENVRAFSQAERFQMMSKKNPNLLKLKEKFGLELQ